MTEVDRGGRPDDDLARPDDVVAGPDEDPARPDDDLARLALADALLADQDPWVLCTPVRDEAGEVVDLVWEVANAAAEDEVGLGPLAGRRMLQTVPEAVALSFPGFVEALRTGVGGRQVVPRVVRPDLAGWTPGWTELVVRPTEDALVISWRDVTEDHRQAQDAEHSEARLQALLENAGEVIAVFAADGSMLYVSPSRDRILGSVGEDPTPTSRVHPEDQDVVRDAFRTLVTGPPGGVAEVEVRIRHGDGRWIWVHAAGSNHLADPSVRGIVVNLRDVTEQRAAADRLREQALQDPLTGLPNRRLVDAELERALARTERGTGLVGLVLCDVDYFKSINDSLGHPMGDRVLEEVARRLRAAVRPADVVGRIGGDEFVVICEDLPDAGQLDAVTSRMRAALRDTYLIDDRSLEVTVTLGGSAGARPVTATQLLSEADTALYEAKRAGRDRSQLFDRTVHRRHAERVSRRAALRRAVREDELCVHYQPKVDLRTGRRVAAEALVRWTHPQEGLLLPAAFLPAAEETTLVVDLDAWVLRRATLDAATWTAGTRETGSGAPDGTDPALSPLHPDAPPVVNVNLSGRHLTHPDLLTHLDAALAASGLDPGRLEVEVTETVLLSDLQAVRRILLDVQARGCRIALDDFGTGYSSLTWLQRLPVDTVKLDRSFVADLLSPDGGFAPEILGGITSLAHGLGKAVVAEGVETQRQADILVDLGCDLAQGWLFGRPEPASPFPQLGEPTGS